MPVDLRRRTVKLKQVDNQARTKGDLIAHDPPQEGNFTMNREI